MTSVASHQSRDFVRGLSGVADASEPATCSVTELLKRIRAGERAAAGELFTRYHRHVLKTLVGVLGRDSEISDVLQETFIRALRNVGDLREPDALLGWLSRVATFTARDVIRRRRRRRWLTFAPAESFPASYSETPDETGREAIRRAYTILDKLPDDERIAFSLRFFADMELTEVATACNCSLATIKRRLQRGQERFLELAGEDAVLRDRVVGGTRLRRKR